MNKNITIIGINYFPEDSSIGLYTTEMAENLVSKGYHVSVITGFPYYPQWKIRSDYKSKNYLFKETINGVRVYRSKQFVPQNPTFFKRILHMISFTFGNFINLFKVSKPDVVISIIPFTTSAFLGWILKKRYGSKLWIHIQDFEFDIAINSGLLKGNKKWIINGLNWFEKKIFEKADITSTISYGMLQKLQVKTSYNNYYLPNWVDVSLFNISKNISHEYLNSNKFKILYSGNIGTKQDWEFFFKFLSALKNIENVEVIIIGEGAEKENVLREINKYSFVSHYNLIPYEELPMLLSSADLHILFQKNDIIDAVMPSKLLGMMASSRPSIVTGNLGSEAAKIFKESNVGYFFESNSPTEVINCILSLQGNAILGDQIGKNARNFVFDKFSKVKVLNKFIDQIDVL